MKPMLIPLLALGLMSGASAQVSLTTLGVPYTQDFNTLPTSGSATWTNNSTIPGWFHARTGTGTTIVANNGGNNAGNLYSYGTGTDAERALGSVGSGGAAAGNFFWGVRLQNNTGSTITSLQISYTGEQWRNSAAAAQTVAFSYLVGTPTVTGSLAEFQSVGVAEAALNFTSPITGGTAAAIDGNALANRVAISHTIAGLSIPAGTEIMLRWSDPDHGGADHGLSIDDFSVTPNGAAGGLDADLEVTLVDSPDPVLAGNNLTYLATGTNNGPADATDVSLSLPLPATTTFVSVTPSAGGVCTNPAVGANGTVACTWAGPTASTTSRSMTIVANVPAVTASGATLSATLTGASATTDPDATNNTAIEATTVNTSADIVAALTDSPDPVNAGGQLTYVATATNGGPSDAQGVSLTLPLPAGTSFVSATPSAGGACNAASPVVCSWAGATAPTTSRTATVVALVAPDVANGTVLNAEATAAATTSDPVPGNNVAAASTSVAVAADLSMALTVAPDPVTAGTNLSYLATLTNGGPSSAQDVSITLPLPGGTSFVSATPSAGGSCNAASPVVCSWAGATAPAASRSVTVVAAVPASVLAGTMLSATATAGALSNDPNGANDSASASTTVAASADLVLAFTAAPATVAPGLAITFTGTATNNGPSDAQDVQIAVALGQGVLFASSSASAGGTCTGPASGSTGTVTCTWGGASAPGSARSVAVTAYSYNRGAAGANASATSATSDPTPANNAASGSVVVGTGGVQDPPVFIPTADRTVLALLALLLGLVGFAAVRRHY